MIARVLESVKSRERHLLNTVEQMKQASVSQLEAKREELTVAMQSTKVCWNNTPTYILLKCELFLSVSVYFKLFLPHLFNFILVPIFNLPALPTGWM